MAVVIVDGFQLAMKIDTGATVSLISEATCNSYWTARSRPKLEPTDVSLRTYSGEKLSMRGQTNVTVSYHGQSQVLRTLVIQGDGRSRLWPSTITSSLESVLAKHTELFGEELELVKNAKVQIQVAKDCKPRYFKPQPVPYALGAKV